MPFDPPFREFKDGDLVYGIAKNLKGGLSRTTYLDDKFKPEKAATIDVYEPIPFAGTEPSAEDQKSFIDALKKHDVYKSANVTLVQSEIEFTAAQKNEATRRKDKMGLYWCTKVAGKHVHFVLDGIDQKAVVEKTYATDNPKGRKAEDGEKATKMRGITGSELRWIYRQRADPEVQKYIQFWHKGEQVSPPWEGEEQAKLWASYTPKKVYVHADQEEKE